MSKKKKDYFLERFIQLMVEFEDTVNIASEEMVSDAINTFKEKKTYKEKLVLYKFYSRIMGKQEWMNVNI